MRPFTATLSATLCLATLAPAGELEKYVAKEDGALAYPIHSEAAALGVRAINVLLTSQNWRGNDWRHWLSIIVPPQVDPHGKGVLIIEGGSNGGAAPSATSKEAIMLAAAAKQLRAPVALLGQVPNQPLFGGLYEDDLIAHTFKHYLDGGGDDWPALLPMTKSAVRAMDALGALATQGKLTPAGGDALRWDEFIVTGASKRGWTTYLTSAIDKRVCAMAPMVIDVLNMPEQMKWQKQSYGEYSDMIKPYTERGIQRRMSTAEGRRLNTIVDPFSYRERFTMPKLVLLGTNDPYWTVDSAALYFDELPARKSLYYMPNAGHGLGLAALATGNAFFAAQLDEKPFPELEYKRDGDTIEVSWQGDATQVEHWSANSPDRDFRERRWSSVKLESQSIYEVGGTARARGNTSARLTSPPDGWSAHFVRVTFPPVREDMLPFQLATPIMVLPELFPHPLP